MVDSCMDPKRAIAQFYASVAGQFDQVGPETFAVFGRLLVEFAQLAPGMRILDVATGRGANLFPSMQAVGPRGLAIGVDLAFDMLSQTRRAALAAPQPANPSLVQMDAELLAFPPAAFDLLLCGFAIFFLDPARALPEWRRVLRPGGRVAISLMENNDPRWNWYEDSLRAIYQRLDQPIPTSERPGVRSLRHPDEVSAALQEAGFRDVRGASFPVHAAYPDVDTWWAAKWTHGSRRALESLPPDVLEEFKVTAMAMALKTGLDENRTLGCILATRN